MSDDKESKAKEQALLKVLGRDQLILVRNKGAGSWDHLDEVDLSEVSRAESGAIHQQGCAAELFKMSQQWDNASLEIKWKSEQREFVVAFKGEGQMSLNVENLLSKEAPLYIAQSSNCECGETLALGDYNILTTNNDFKFEGTFFCPKCRKRFVAEKSGLKNAISKWITGLKKFEIRASGIGIERE